MKYPSLNGLLVLDKPAGITSRDAVDRAQAWFPRGTRLGHTGTLDPLATGVLVLCVGSTTRLTEYVQDMDKTYFTTVRLGARSDTDDADGTVTPLEAAPIPDRASLEAALRSFLGEIDQVPPAYSAAKLAGRRAYDLARRGQAPSLQPRRVRIDSIDVTRYDYPELDLMVRCGKGTYIRSLARDLGDRLGCGGLVQVLRRTRVGPFRAEDGISPHADASTARSHLLPPSLAVSGLPSVRVGPREVDALRQGRGVRLATEPSSLDVQECAAFDERNELVAVCRPDPERGLLLPAKVMTGST